MRMFSHPYFSAFCFVKEETSFANQSQHLINQNQYNWEFLSTFHWNPCFPVAGNFATDQPYSRVGEVCSCYLLKENFANDGFRVNCG